MTYKASNGKEIEVVIIRKNNKNIYFRVKNICNMSNIFRKRKYFKNDRKK